MNPFAWHRIVAQRDFNEVPRHVLVADDAENAFYLLDAGPDDLGSPSAVYTIHDAGNTLEDAMARFERHADDPATNDMAGCIPVAHVQFDGTRALKLTSLPIE